MLFLCGNFNVECFLADEFVPQGMHAELHWRCRRDILEAAADHGAGLSPICCCCLDLISSLRTVTTTAVSERAEARGARC